MILFYDHDRRNRIMVLLVADCGVVLLFSAPPARVQSVPFWQLSFPWKGLA